MIDFNRTTRLDTTSLQPDGSNLAGWECHWSLNFERVHSGEILLRKQFVLCFALVSNIDGLTFHYHSILCVHDNSHGANLTTCID